MATKTTDNNTRNQILIVVLVTAALGVLYWQFMYSPLAEEKDEQQATNSRLEREYRKLKDEERIQNAMIKCRPELEALNRKNELMLPSDSESVAFLKNLTNMAGSAGLSQGPTKKLKEEKIAAPPAIPADEAEPTEEDGAVAAEKPCWEAIPGLEAPKNQEGYVRVPFEIEVRGTFHQLTKYFWMLHEHAKAGRIITVENLVLSDPKGSPDGVQITAKFTAVGYRQAGDPEARRQQAEARQTAKQAVEDATAKRDAQAEAAAEGKAPPSANPPAKAPAPTPPTKSPGSP